MASPTGIQTPAGTGSDPFVEADEQGGSGTNYWRQRVSPFPLAATPAAPTAVTVGASSALAVSSNQTRTGLIITNLSKNVISVGINNPAVLNSGITLIAYGSAWIMGPQDFSNGDIYLIASAAGSPVAVQEFAV